MKPRIILSLVVAATAIAAATIALYDTGTQIRSCGAVPEVLAAFEPAQEPIDRSGVRVLDGDGAETGLADYSGQGIVLNFWATWCAPCVREMPALDRLREALIKDGVEVLALSGDRGGRSAVEPFYEKNGIRNLSILIDKGLAAARAMEVRGRPTTILIDGRGIEIGRLVGAAEWDMPESVDFLRDCLADGRGKEGS